MSTENRPARARWTFVSRLVVRCAGFPMDLLLALSRAAVAQSADAVLLAEAEVEQRALALAEQFRAAVARARSEGDAATLRLLSKARRAMALGRTNDLTALPDCTLHEAAAALAAARAEAAQRLAQARADHAQALPGLRAQLRATCRDTWVQEAVFVSNPDAYERSFSAYLNDDAPLPPRDARLRKIERRLVTYLQRLCAKNDTASFFGPMNYGTLGARDGPAVVCRRVPGKLRERRVFCSFWMVAALAREIAAEPAVAPLLAPQLHPMWEVRDATLRRADGARALPLGAATASWLAAVDGRTPLGRLRAAAADGAAFDASFGKLLDRGVLRLEVPLPSTVFDPLASLMAFVQALPAAMPERTAWLQRLTPFADWTRRMERCGFAERRSLGAQLEAHFAGITGQAVRRHAGKTYADRTPFYEECAGTVEELSFSETFAQGLRERLAPALALSGAWGEHLARHYRRAARAAFARIGGGRVRMPYAEFIAGIESLEQAGQLELHDAELVSFRERLHALVAARSDGQVARLDDAAIAPLLSAGTGTGLHISPDLMLDAASVEDLGRGDYRVVLGEVHQFLAMWGSQLLFDPDANATRQETHRLLDQLPGYRGLATMLHTRVHKGLLHESFPGTWIELFGRPAASARDVVALRDLEVVDDGGALQLVDRRNGRRLVVYNSGDEKLHLWAFAVPRVSSVPIRLPGHTPRIEVGGTIYQRACWECQPTALRLAAAEGGDFAGFLAARRLRARLGMPRHVFYRVAGETKPLYLDFDSPLLVELFIAQLGDDQVVSFSEMMPGPDGLWMQDAEGRYCLELRGTAFQLPATAGAAVRHDALPVEDTA